MADPLSQNGDVLSPPGRPVQMAMAKAPELPPSGSMPAGKTSPSTFLLPTREPVGGAPARAQEVMPGRAAAGVEAVPHIARLKATLGKPEFLDVLQSIKNSGMSREEIVALANEFNGPLARSSSIKKALETIFSRHRRLVDF